MDAHFGSMGRVYGETRLQTYCRFDLQTSFELGKCNCQYVCNTESAGLFSVYAQVCCVNVVKRHAQPVLKFQTKLFYEKHFLVSAPPSQSLYEQL